MWRKEEDGKPRGASEISTGSVNPTTPAGLGSNSGANISPKAAACVSQGIKIKGELTGSEDLFVDGLVEGRITVPNATVTVGPNATVKADITARDLVVRGRVEGKLTGTDRLQIWHSARIEGDMKAERISIEEGAQLHGKMEAGKASSGSPEKPRGKKDESQSSKESSAEEKSASGAAVAGAD